MKRIGVLTAAATVAVGIVLLGWRIHSRTDAASPPQAPRLTHRNPTETAGDPTSAVLPDSPAGSKPAAADERRERDDGAEGAPIAAELNDPEGSAQRDVDVLHELVLLYARLMRHPVAPPIGGDQDLAKALAGSNPQGLVILPRGHRAVTPQGRLLDRWGTPYFVHPVGGGTIEIRSAGPDRRLFTQDDLVPAP